MDDILMSGPLRLNMRRHEVECNGKTARLTPVEARVLSTLLSRPNTVWTYSEIEQAVYGPDFSDTKSMILLHIRHLRQKIESDPTHPTHLMTVLGVGYRISS